MNNDSHLMEHVSDSRRDCIVNSFIHS